MFLRNYKSKYCFKDKFYKRIIRFLYVKFINEPFVPKGKTEIFVTTYNYNNSNRKHNQIQIRFSPEKFTPGNLEVYFFDKFSDTKIYIR